MEERRLVEFDLARRAEALLRPDHQAILAACVGKPGDLLPIGRPDGRALRRPRASRQVTRIALLGGDGEDLTAGGEQRARPTWRQRRRLDPLRGVHPARLGPRQVAAARDRELRFLPAGWFEQMEVAGLFIDDDATSGVERLDVVVLVMRELGELFGRDLVFPDVRGPVAIGNEVNRVTHPYRPGVERAL